MTRLLRSVTTAGILLLTLGLIGGCGSSAPRSSSSTSAKPAASGCAKLPLHSIAAALGAPRLELGPTVGSKPPICGLLPPGKQSGGTLVNLMLGYPATSAAFSKQVKYYKSGKFTVDYRTLSYGRMVYVSTPNSKTPSQTLTLYANGREYQVMVGILAAKPFTESQLLKVAHLIVGA
ncbi:MAG: hypothetical protein ACYCVZ_13145 [Streptosporangiaceae bacterium]